MQHHRPDARPPRPVRRCRVPVSRPPPPVPDAPPCQFHAGRRPAPTRPLQFRTPPPRQFDPAGCPLHAAGRPAPPVRCCRMPVIYINCSGAGGKSTLPLTCSTASPAFLLHSDLRPWGCRAAILQSFHVSGEIWDAESIHSCWLYTAFRGGAGTCLKERAFRILESRFAQQGHGGVWRLSRKRELEGGKQLGSFLKKLQRLLGKQLRSFFRKRAGLGSFLRKLGRLLGKQKSAVCWEAF